MESFELTTQVVTTYQGRTASPLQPCYLAETVSHVCQLIAGRCLCTNARTMHLLQEKTVSTTTRRFSHKQQDLLCNSSSTLVALCAATVRLMADDPSFLYKKLVRESRYKTFVRVS